MESFKIPSFQSGINEYYAEGLIKPYEATKAHNCDISEGSLTTCKTSIAKHTLPSNINSLTAYYGANTNYVVCGSGNKLKKADGTDLFDINGTPLDFLNFEYQGKRILVGCSKNDIPFMHDGSGTRRLKNRRPKFDNVGNLSGFIDANGQEHANESTITTYAPKGDFLELHYDRLWIAGDNENPDRIYFSTANINGADIEDFTIPLAEETEINQHGGFLDVRSYDGGKIIGLKVIFNSVVIFKTRSAYKIYGSSPDNYQLVDLFSCNGAIADKSIAVGNNGAYYLNSDGIYFYDGTNTNLVSHKIKNIISRMNTNYADKSVSIFKNNKYIVAIPVDGSTTNNMIIEFDTTNNSFMTYDIKPVGSLLDYNNELLYSSNNQILSFKNGTSYLPLVWETPYFDFGKKNTRKMSNYIYFRAKGNGKIRFTLMTDRKDKSIEIDITGEEKLYRKKLKNKGRMMKLKIENVNNSTFTLTAPEVLCELDED